MKSTIVENIQILKDKLELNKRIIDENQQTLREIIGQPGSAQRVEMFTEHFRTNLELHSQNHMFIKLQFELQRALSSYHEFKTFGTMSLS